MAYDIPPELQDLINQIIAYKDKERLEYRDNDMEKVQENLYIEDYDEIKYNN